MNIDAILDRAVQDGTIPGAILLATDIKGNFEYRKVLGEITTSGDKDQLKLNTVFTIASMTKLLTSIAVLQLHERGIINLDQDICKHVPVLARQPILTGFKEDGSPILVTRQKPITMRLLLTHSSGAGYDFMDSRLQRYNQYIGKSGKGSGTVGEIFDYPLLFQPGDGWAYGSGIAWAGKVVESLAGKSLESYMQESIFKPLGISRITFFPMADETVKGQLADMNIRDETTGKLKAVPPGLPFFGPLQEALGGEGAFADLTDYLKVLQSILRDDGALLQSETTKLMFQPQLPTGTARAALKMAMDSPGWAVGDFSGPNEYDWAFGGILVAGDNHPTRNRGCLIWSGAPNLFWFVDRKTGICGLFGTQVLPSAEKGVQVVISAFEKYLYSVAACQKQEI